MAPFILHKLLKEKKNRFIQKIVANKDTFVEDTPALPKQEALSCTKIFYQFDSGVFPPPDESK